ncbi:MAG: hypothetical protein QOJ50_3797, partial [Cryptosporangiaceae bacterium]|nr:hypothetical protein [Cryptosporangiaceae bacterium]
MTVLDERRIVFGPLPQNRAVYSGFPAAPERTLAGVFAATVRDHPGAPALDDGTTTLTYAELATEAEKVAIRLTEVGVGRGHRVGVRIPSGTAELYVAILGALVAGAAYVPVDADDPAERAELVFGEAGVRAVLGAGGELAVRPGLASAAADPGPGDDAWIIFTSGSTGKPKGVAVSHRSAAAFADAEARLFLAGDPLRPGDRVLAGLSVAFDASCEEMWLAWRSGACLVAAPRSLVRSGSDLAPWLAERAITAVSTVPTLASLWPAEALGKVRLLIFGGEACPPELAARLAVPGREVWNTYGPTEATVVACAAPLTGHGPVRIGLPLDGWDLAVTGPDGELVPMGGTGELVIGGVGLARYLDQDKDAEKFAPLPALGWDRAYRSGDLVRADPAGLVFLGRADEQVKLGGRRIELGEVDAALSALPGVAGGAAAVKTTAAGHQVLAGYVVPGPGYDREDALARLRSALPAALVPLLAEVEGLPVRTSGKVDRAALPWPLPGAGTPPSTLTGTQGWLAGLWGEILGRPATAPGDGFFASGGSSLAAAQLVSRIRERHPGCSVGDLYQYPVLADLAAVLDATAPDRAGPRERVTPVPLLTGLAQAVLMVPLQTIRGLRWVVALAALGNVLAGIGGFGWAPRVSWWLVALGWLLLISPPGRLAIAAGGARLLLGSVRPGTYPRGGIVHLRLWTAEQLAIASGATNLTGGWLSYYARALGARIAPDTDLHSLPPVTGMLSLGSGCAIEPEVDLSGHWLDGDQLHLGRIGVGAGASVGARSTLLPGAAIMDGAKIAPGSCVLGVVPAGERWAGVPAARTGKARFDLAARPARTRRWTLAYALTSFALDLLPAVAVLPGLAAAGWLARGHATLPGALGGALLAVPLATAAIAVTYAGLILAGARLLGIGLRPGTHPVHGRIAWQAWATERLMDLARTGLFPLYASLFTPLWLRALGMTVGRRVEASTVLALPTMTTVGDGAFLADDTMVASYELRGGMLRIDEARIGKRAFLGNSGMTAPGRRVPKRGLVGVLSAAPKRAKAGTSWLGMPPMELPRAAEKGDESLTFDPPRRLMVARGLVELCRIVPVMCGAALALLTLATLFALVARFGYAGAALLSGAVLTGAGVLACGLAVAAKWLLVGRFTVSERPLWSAFVWRTELADTFVEVLAAPWLVGALTGTPALT